MSQRVETKALRTQMPGESSLADVVMEAASIMVSHVIPHLPEFERGAVGEVGGETTIGAPDGRRFTVSFWVRDAASAATQLNDRAPQGNA